MRKQCDKLSGACLGEELQSCRVKSSCGLTITCNTHDGDGEDELQYAESQSSDARDA